MTIGRNNKQIASKMIRRFKNPLVSGLGVAALGLAAWAASAPSVDWHIAGPFGGTATSLAVDPENPKVVLAGSLESRVFQSTDAGGSWNVLPFPKRHLNEVTS